MKNVLEKTSKVKIDIFNLSKKFILIKVIKILFNIQLKSQRKKQELHVHSIYNYIIYNYDIVCIKAGYTDKVQ